MAPTRFLTNRDRTAALTVTACLYLLAAQAFLPAPGTGIRHERPAIAAFDVAPPAPPPPVPAEVAVAKPAGTAAPAGRTAVASSVEASVPILVVPPPVAAATVAEDGAATSAGAVDTGIGAGAGGTGSGRGAGGAGDGGGSGVAGPARLLWGAIGPRDYPRAARRAGAEGVVTVRFTVGTDGRPSGCTTMRSSGSAALDEATCSLIERRYRYAPARDAAGAAVAEERGWQQRWWLERRAADAATPR